MAPRPAVNRRQVAGNPVRTGRITKIKNEQSVKGTNLLILFSFLYAY